MDRSNIIDRKDETDWWQVAIDHIRADRFEAALIAIERFRELSASFRQSDLHYAWILTHLRKFDDAERVLLSMKRRTESRWRSAYLSCWVHLSRGRGNHKDVEHWSRELIDEFPDRTSGYIYLGCSLASQGKLVDAEQVLQQGADCEGNPDEALYNLGKVLCAQGRYFEAKEAFEAALELDPHYELVATALEDVNTALRLVSEIRAYDGL